MNREIKFRAFYQKWDKIFQDWGNGEMKYDFSSRYLPATYEDGGTRGFCMQYTGLKDKNGKEIYEGDIVQIDIDYPTLFSEESRIGIVEWDNFHAGFDINVPGANGLGQHAHFKQIEVLGNIYENSELLNGKD